jgi:hypothetical protein
MAKLWGIEYSKDDLLARVGDVSQIGGVRVHTLSDGVERGVRAAEFRTGSGLNFTVLVDRGLDISTAEYKGQPLAWRSSTGDTSPAYYEEPGLGWLRSFYGGLVVTCGLTYAGAPNVDQGKPLGLHGRVSNLPASNVYADAAWEDDSYDMWVQGKVRETAVFGENIELSRRISARLGEPKIWIHDVVTNLGYQETEHMILYHINVGFPVIDAGSRLIAPVLSHKPRDADAEIEKELYADFSAPIEGFRERVYYLEMAASADGSVGAALVNPGFKGGDGFGFYMRYSKQELPKFTEWKMMGQGTYVVGMEPANCWVEGRAKERERGTLQFLKPGEAREYHLELGVLASQEDIQVFEENVQAVLARAR